MKILPKPSGASVPHVNKEVVRPNRETDEGLDEDSREMLFKLYEKDFEHFKYSPKS